MAERREDLQAMAEHLRVLALEMDSMIARIRATEEFIASGSAAALVKTKHDLQSLKFRVTQQLQIIEAERANVA